MTDRHSSLRRASFSLAGLLAGLLTLTASIPASAAASGFVEVPGGRLWYEAQGAGSPIVFLHDGLLPSAVWDETFPRFAQSFRAVRYDRRGFGRSAPPEGPFSDVDDLRAVLDSLKIDRAVLVGCSSGARIALDFALASPERVEGLVLVGPVVGGLPLSDHFYRREFANLRPGFLEKDTAGTVERWARDPYLTDPANTAARERVRQLLTASPGPAIGTVSEGRTPEPPAAGRLAQVRQPAVIVVGASDIPDVHAHAGALEAGIAHARRIVLPGAGHLVPLERPDAFYDAVFPLLRPADAARQYLQRLDSARPFEEGRRLLQYDATAPLDVKEAGSEVRDGVRVVDLSYASPVGGRVPAFLVLPPQKEEGESGRTKHPAAVFLHHGQGNRSSFLDEAVGLARRGLVSLLIEAPFLRPENQSGRGPLWVWEAAPAQKDQAQTILDVRRGFDLLAARPDVDTSRLAYVGHSLGATVGGALASTERRPIALVLIAGLPSLTHSYRQGKDRAGEAFRTLLTPEEQERYVAALAPLDAVHHIGHAAPARLLFQFAHHDEYISAWDAALYLEAASSPKEAQWFATDHNFKDEGSRARRGEWLAKVLGLR